VPLNDNGCTLHGGDIGYDRRVWTVVYTDNSKIVLNLIDGDLVEAFPGALNVTVTYEVTRDNDLVLSYYATTDTTTLISMTSHIYWNLNGFANNIQTILDHELNIAASKYTPIDMNLIPTGEISPVSSAPWLDFTNTKTIGKDIAKGTVTPNGGYDNNLVLDSHTFTTPVVTAHAPLTGITLQIFTTQIGVQFYSSNFLDGTISRKKDQIYPGGKNESYQRYSGFAMETQHFPDSIHHPEWPTTVLTSGDSYQHQTIYKFSLIEHSK